LGERALARVVLLAVAVVGILTLLVAEGETDGIDSRVGRAAELHDHATRRVAQLVTDLGSWPAVIPLAVLVCLLVRFAVPLRTSIGLYAVALLANELGTRALKAAVGRPRPTVEPIAATLGPAFPSGHSSTSAAFCVTTALLLTRAWPLRRRAALLVAGVPVAVAATRVLLGLHWLSDVVAGLAFGAGIAALVFLGFQRLRG
jgi:undecaprenyl-diphosphatase